jgi:hypothetical protein
MRQSRWCLFVLMCEILLSSVVRLVNSSSSLFSCPNALYFDITNMTTVRDAVAKAFIDSSSATGAGVGHYRPDDFCTVTYVTAGALYDHSGDDYSELLNTFANQFDFVLTDS